MIFSIIMNENVYLQEKCSQIQTQTSIMVIPPVEGLATLDYYEIYTYTIYNYY